MAMAEDGADDDNRWSAWIGAAALIAAVVAAKKTAGRPQREDAPHGEEAAYAAQREEIYRARADLAARRRVARERHHRDRQIASDRRQVEERLTLALLQASPILAAAVRSFLSWEFDPGPAIGQFERLSPKGGRVGIADLDRGDRLILSWEMRGESTTGYVSLAGRTPQSFAYSNSFDGDALVFSAWGLQDFDEAHAAAAARLLNARLAHWPPGAKDGQRIILRATAPCYRESRRKGAASTAREWRADQIAFVRPFLDPNPARDRV